jgi:hypothetical protein
MSDFQSKIQKSLLGLQKGVQKSFQEGKEKIQQTQEIISLKNEISKIEDNRDELYLALGKSAFEKIVNEEMEDELLEGVVDQINYFNEKITELKSILSEKTGKEETTTCECGAEVTIDSKFCPNCGKKLDEE